MMWIKQISKLLFLFILVNTLPVNAQDNVGIGTKNPHPSAILEITDSSRGVLIPSTDTVAVAAYMATFVLNPGIADGLLIFDTKVNTYLYYDAVANDWKELINLVGPMGPRGPQGPIGPTGDTGLSTKWTDSNITDPNTLYNPAVDTCGDWYINNETGKVWWLWCDSANGLRPPMYIDTLSYDNYIGELLVPDERIVSTTVHWSGTSANFQNMSNAGVNLIDISGLTYSITVNRDEIAYIWVTAYGTTSKFTGGDDLSYAQYDIHYDDGAGEFYYGRSPDSIAHIFTIGPNGPPAPSETFGLKDLSGWHVSSFKEFTGPISPFPCGPCGTITCPVACPPMNATITITVKGGNRNTGSAGSGDFIILGDGSNTNQAAHMTIFAIIRRNPATWKWKR